MKIKAVLLFFLTFCISYSACYGNTNLAAPLTKVTLQLKWKHQFQFAGFYAAIEQGFYKDVGLDVELREYQSGMDLVNEVLDGRAQFGISDTSLIIDKSRGKPVVLLANIFQHSPMVLLSRGDSGIYSPAQMVGKKIMLDEHDQENALIMAMLNTESVTLQQTIRQQHSFNLDDFIKGEVDIIGAYATNEPGILKERQVKYNVIDPINYGIDFYGNNIFTSNQYLQTNPKQSAQFIAASLKGWEYALANPQKIIDLILEKYSTQKTRSALEFEAKTLYRYILPNNIPLGTIDLGRIDRIVELYKSLEMIPNDFVLKDFIYHSVKESLQLTDAEQLWIKQYPKVTIGVDPNWAPFEFIDEQGHYLGMASEYMKLISEKTGLEFIVQDNATWKDVVLSAKSNKLDLLPAVMESPQRKDFLDFTKPHINYPMVIVTEKESLFISDLKELENKLVVVIDGYVTQDILRNNHPSIKLKPAKDLQQALKWVSSGEVDALIDNLASVSYSITHMGISNLRISGTTPYDFALGVAVPKGNEVLLSIIQKTLDSISDQEKQKIQQQWISVNYEQRFDYKKYFYISLVALLIILLVLLWNWRLSIEITARKRVENELHENQIVLESKNEILELLAKGGQLKIILEALIRHLEAEHPEMVGSILLLDKQKKHFVEGISLRLPEHYMQALEGAEIGPNAGSCGAAVFRGEQVIVEDLMTHPDWVAYKELAQSAGLRACWSQPIFSSKNDILGTFSIYYHQPATPSQLNLNLMYEFSLLTALAIETYQKNEQLKKLSLAVSQSANIVVITDNKGIIEYVNPNFTDITGYTSEEAIGVTSRILKSGSTPEAVYSELWSTLLAGNKWEGELLNRKKSGQLYWAWESIAPIKDTEGRVTHFVAVQLDYTERKQAAKALQESELRFRQLFEGNNDLIFIIDLKTRQIIEANKNAPRFLGYTHDELLQRKITDLEIKENASLLKEQFKQLKLVGSALFEYRLLHRNGSGIPVEISAKSIKYDNITVIQAIARDISQRKEVEAKLIASEFQYRDLIENTNMVAWNLDIESFCFTYVSPRAEKMLGYPIEEWKQKGFWVSHIVEQDRERIIEECMQAIKDGKDYNLEYRMIKAEGQLIWLRDTVTVNKNSGGKPISLNGFLIDIDERKKTEIALEKAKLIAEEADKVKSEFLATMTHELRTPMNGVLGMAQILADTSLDTEQRESVDVILRSGSSLLEIINDVLDLSKLEEHHVTLENRSFNLEKTIANALAIIQANNVKKALELKVFYPTECPRDFMGDSTRIQQVILNLLANAFKFTEQGYIHLSVAYDLISDEQVNLKMSVKDTGIGIAVESIEHLFDPFVQADQTTTRRFGGSGLGLAVSKKLVKLMQGDIGVNSILGQGSEFWVILPLSTSAEVIQKLPNEKVVNKSIIFDAKILIVDDDAVNQKIAISMLKKSGLTCMLAENGQQAFDLWQAEEFDLILMDCRMPIMDGYEATKIIRAQELKSGERIPIIALTANSSYEDRQHCIDSGMDEVVTKPFKKEFLLEALSQWIPGCLQKIVDNQGTSNKKIESDSLERQEQDKTLDILVLEKLKKEMEEDFPEIYVSLVQTIKDIIYQFEQGMVQIPNEKTAQLAHSLKSPSANLGAIKLSKIASELEKLADNKELKSMGHIIEQLIKEYYQVLLELDKVQL